MTIARTAVDTDDVDEWRCGCCHRPLIGDYDWIALHSRADVRVCGGCVLTLASHGRQRRWADRSARFRRRLPSRRAA